MATTEDVLIFKVNTQEAVQSVGDLKNNIKVLKKDIDGLTIGTTEYQEKLNELKQNQNALKDAMYATSGSMDDVAKAASGMSDSYNSLVHQMAALKEEWRATNDEARRNELGKQIGDINQKLKDMDASVGNFQRNVGNYESGVSGLVAKFDAWGETLKMMPPTLGATKESIGKVGETMQLVGKQPILGIIGLLAPIIMKITSALQDNETAMGAVKKIMDSLQPAFDILQQTLEWIAQGFAQMVDWLINLVGGSGWMNKLISVVTGVGNVFLQYLLTPIRSAIAGFKGLANIVKDVFTGQWGDVKKHAKEAGEGIADAWKEGFSFKNNYESGQKVGDEFIEGIASKKAKAAEVGKELKDAMSLEEKYGISEDSGEEEYDQFAALAAEEAQRKKDEATLKAMLEGITEKERLQAKAAQHELDMEKAVADGVKEYEEEKKKAREDALKQNLATFNAVASATSGLMNSLADMYESDEKNAKKNAKKVKALRIASATIDMFQGAVTAFSSSMQLGPVAGPIVGAVNAAAVIAMGIANINKIKSANVDNPSENGGATPSASVSAPSIDTNIPTIRNATSASEEERLNRMASPQKVYILQSDIEAAGSQSKVQIEESSF